MTERLTTDIFISRSKKTHNCKYKYPNAIYINNSSKVEVLCPSHGSFFIRAAGHMSGKGCMDCAIEKRSKLKIMSNDEFISRSIAIHGDRYDYTDTIYTNAKTKVKIKCRDHGFFYQIPSEHTKGSNCKLCSARKITEIDFVSRSRVIHKNKYSYKNNGFTLGGNEVSITCPRHGTFKMNAQSHLKGHGCKDCAKHNLGWRRSNYVDFCRKNYNGKSVFYIVKMISDTELFFKVGISVHGSTGRYKFQRKKYKMEKVVEVKSKSDLIWDLEKLIIKELKEYKYGEKTKLIGGHTECFKQINTDTIRDIIDKHIGGNYYEYDWFSQP